MNRPNSFDAIERLWSDHFFVPFPDGWAGREVRGVDITLLDSYTSGCVSTFLSRDGMLDLWRTAVLGLCYRDLSIVLTELDGGARTYFARLEELARLVLEAVCAGARQDE
jgi:hypothetical protein